MMDIFGTDFTQFGDFKANNATKEGCSLVWDSVPGPGATLDQLGTLLGVLGASKPPKYTPKCLFWGHCGPDFSRFWEFKTQSASWESCGIVWDSIPVAWDQFTPI